MAKRSRRVRRPQPTTLPVTLEPVLETTDDASPGQFVKRKTMNFAQEYAYVYKELRNVLIIAIVMFGVLVGLSYII